MSNEQNDSMSRARAIARDATEQQASTAAVDAALDPSRCKAVDVYVPVCVTLLVDRETGKVVSNGATRAAVDYDGMPWSENQGDVWDHEREIWRPSVVDAEGEDIENAEASDVAVWIVTDVLSALDYPDAEREREWFDRHMRQPNRCQHEYGTRGGICDVCGAEV